MHPLYIIADGANIAFSKKTGKNKARVSNLDILVRYLAELKQEFPIEYEIIADASLKHRIDDCATLEGLYRSGVLVECPSGMKADEFIISFFLTKPDQTLIISNDNFSEYSIPEENRSALCKYTILFDTIIIPAFNSVFARAQGIDGMELEPGKQSMQVPRASQVI